MENNSYIKGIDGIRAIAVLAVLIFHLDINILPGGFTGVDIFFVISGYVVSASLLRNYNIDFKEFALEFYKRRIIRIFPSLIVCLIVSSIVTVFFIPASWLSYTTNKTAIAAFLGLSNFALILFNDGYFSPRTDFNPFTHTWSLGVEEQFYLIFPLLFYIHIKYKNYTSTKEFFFRHAVTLLALISLFHSFKVTHSNPLFAFYLLPSRFWELAAGVLLFQVHSKGFLIPKSKLNANIFLLSGVSLITLGFIYANKQNFPFPLALLSVVGTMSLISGFIGKFETRPTIQKAFEFFPITYIGKISYSLYLWHWPVYVLFRWTTGLETTNNFFSAVLISILCAILSYHFIEKPFRSGFYKTYPAKKAVRSGLKGIVFSLLISSIIFLVQPYISLSVTKNRKIWYPHAWPEKVNHPHKILEGRKIFAIGDSHTGAYSTMFQKLSDEYGVKTINMSAAGCGVMNLSKPSISEGKRCAGVYKKYLSKIKSSASRGDIVFFASLRMKRLCDQWEIFPKNNIQKNIEAEQKNSEMALHEAFSIIKELNEIGLIVIIDAPKPVFSAPPLRCSDWFNQNNPICTPGFFEERNFLLEHRQLIMDSLNILSKQFQYNELAIWDLFPILCNTPICSAFDEDGQPLFFDGDHLSAQGNRVLYPSFLSVVKKVWIEGNDDPTSALLQ